MSRASRIRLGAVVTAAAVVAGGLAAGPPTTSAAASTAAGVPAAASSFTFGTVGDHGTANAAAVTFQAAGRSNLDFFLSLGDLSYADPASYPESRWCQFVKDNLNSGAGRPAGHAYGQNYPFQIVSGNHESGGDQANNGLIDNFVAPGCLPNRLPATLSPNTGTNPSATGNYAKEYYFDYPAGAATARFIMTSPGLRFTHGGQYPYTAGNAHYQWLSNAIDSARAAGIRWVIVANHYNYISTGAKPDGVGRDYFNLLVSKKVDLILQGHDHTYQRSKQLGFSSCSHVPTGTANTACVTDDGSDNAYTKGRGPVLVIAGNGGKSFYSANPADGEAPYFARIMHNTEQSAGFVKLSVTPTSLSANFVAATGSFTDAFTIAQGSPASRTVQPVADAALRSAYPASNFGLNSILLSDASPAESSLMKYTVAGITGRTITSARLRLYVADGTSDGGQLRPTATSAWTETGVTWGNAPRPVGASIATIGAATTRTWKDVPLSPWALAGDGTYSWRFTPTSTDGLDIGSLQSGVKPSLILTLGGYDAIPPSAPRLTATAVTGSSAQLSWMAATDNVRIAGYRIFRNGGLLATTNSTHFTDTGAPARANRYLVQAFDTAGNLRWSNAATQTATVSYAPTADTFVNRSAPSANYGRSSLVQIDRSPELKQTYLRFGVGGLAGRTITSARVRMYAVDGTPAGGRLYRLATGAWTETGTTWLSRPGTNGALADVGTVSGRTWIEVPLPAGTVGGAGTYDWALIPTSTDGADYGSRESGVPPRLILTVR